MKGWVLILLLLISSCKKEQQPLELAPVIASQVALYPEMDIQDWYKLLHQASMGNRHLGVEDSLIFAFLVDEWGRIEASIEEPMIEYITPDSSIVRLNLRPFKATGGTPERVFDAMKKTWDSFTPSEHQLASHMGELRQAVHPYELKISEDELVLFNEQKKEEGYPAVHHSEVYESLYRPAYRVLERRFIP